MTGLKEFLDTFGHMTIAQIVVVLLALGFLYAIYKKINDYLMKKHDAEQERAAQLHEALEFAKKSPEYRKQSIEIQQHFEHEILDLKTVFNEMCERLTKLEEQNKKKERNKLRNLLLESYRYYANKEKNPSQSWTVMEAEAFWELFRDYEDAGGNGYMHTVVQPEMERLTVVEV